jgi:methyl-accepting chemotaxis protein
MLSIVLGYSLTIFGLLLIPVFEPMMQALAARSLSWQERAVIANNLLNLHDRYWPWVLGAGLVLVAHCVHSMLAMYHVAGPLYRFKAVFQQIGQGNLSIRAALRKGDFLTPEADLMNQMTEQLQAKLNQIKRAQASVAFGVHQLQQAVTATSNLSLAELVRKTELDLAHLKSSLDSFRTDKG